jgi:hypothetical protein
MGKDFNIIMNSGTNPGSPIFNKRILIETLINYYYQVRIYVESFKRVVDTRNN